MTYSYSSIIVGLKLSVLEAFKNCFQYDEYFKYMVRDAHITGHPTVTWEAFCAALEEGTLNEDMEEVIGDVGCCELRSHKYTVPSHPDTKLDLYPITHDIDDSTPLIAGILIFTTGEDGDAAEANEDGSQEENQQGVQDGRSGYTENYLTPGLMAERLLAAQSRLNGLGITPRIYSVNDDCQCCS
jgi:hypothetical protein